LPRQLQILRLSLLNAKFNFGYNLTKGGALAEVVAGSVLLFQLTWCAVLYDRRLRGCTPFLYPALLAFGVVMMRRGYLRLRRGERQWWKSRVVR